MNQKASLYPTLLSSHGDAFPADAPVHCTQKEELSSSNDHFSSKYKKGNFSMNKKNPPTCKRTDDHLIAMPTTSVLELKSANNFKRNKRQNLDSNLNS